MHQLTICISIMKHQTHKITEQNQGKTHSSYHYIDFGICYDYSTKYE